MKTPDDLEILFVVPTLHHGGAESQIINQANLMNEKGINTGIVVLTGENELLPLIKFDQNKVFFLGHDSIAPLTSKSLTRIPNAVKDLSRLLNSIQPKYIIANLPLCHLVTRLVKLFNSNIQGKLWHYHHSVQFEASPLNTLFKKTLHGFSNWLSRKYDDGHIFISRAVEDNIKAFVPIKNGHIIHNAILQKDVSSDYADAYLQKENLKADCLIVFPGRLHPAKGHHFFIKETADFFKRSELKVLTLIVGGGDLQESLVEQVNNLDLNDYYHFTGAVANEKMLSFMKKANLVVVPSIFEGFGNVAVESLMQGTTILASNAGGLPEVITHEVNGFLFHKQNGESLRNELMSIITSSKFINPAELIANYNARFTLESQVDLLYKTLKEN